jgi:hypothetical protein
LKNFFSSLTRITTPINNKSKNNKSSFITQQKKFTKLHIINPVEYIQIQLLPLSHISVWASFRQTSELQTIVRALTAEASFQLRIIVSAQNAEAGWPPLLQVHSLIVSHLNIIKKLLENWEKVVNFSEIKFVAKVTNEKH